jgi:hypothetical protein
VRFGHSNSLAEGSGRLFVRSCDQPGKLLDFTSIIEKRTFVKSSAIRIRLSQTSAIAVRRLKRLPHFPAPQMNQIKGMVTLALIAAHEIFLQNA